MATDVFPEPELPAIPMMLKSAHGGAYWRSFPPSVACEYTGGIDSMPFLISASYSPRLDKVNPVRAVNNFA